MDKDYERNWDYKNSVIKYSISPKPGRIVLFDGSKPHNSSTCTDQKVRVVLSINYF